MSRIARDLVLPAPNTPAIHRSERPVRMARSSATVTARACPSPCPAVSSSLAVHPENIDQASHGVGRYPWPVVVATDWLVQTLRALGDFACLPERTTVATPLGCSMPFYRMRPVLIRILTARSHLPPRHGATPAGCLSYRQADTAPTAM